LTASESFERAIFTANQEKRLGEENKIQKVVDVFAD